MLVNLKVKEYNIEKIGNKACSLIELNKTDNINVPNGFIVDTDEYDIFLDYNNIRDELQNLLAKLTKENVDYISSQICELFDNCYITTDIFYTVMANLNGTKLLAVRSSCIKEDLKENSFAGQYSTFLNVSPDEVNQKVIDCYKSMFKRESLYYFLNNNISITNLKMAVIIQEMVDADYSGVCFTLNPITGRDTEMLIEVSEGLGENMVEGRNKPYQYIYNWYNKKLVQASKSIIIEEILNKCIDNFLKIQLHFGYPCDIEFAIYDNKVYILQSRMITSIKYMGIKDVWTTADFKEGGVSATVCKPLMWSLYEWVFDKAVRDFISYSKILDYSEMNKITNMFYGRGYWNISTIKRALNKIPTFTEEDLNHEYGIDNIEGFKTLNLNIFNISETLKILRKQHNIVKKRFEEVDGKKEEYLKKYFDYLSSQSCHSIENAWKKLLKTDYYAVESYYYWQIYMNTVHQAVYRKILSKFISDEEYLILLNGLHNVSHMRPLNSMWLLSRKILYHADIKEYWMNTDSRDIAADLDKGVTDFYLDDARGIIKNYGYHSEKELDISYPNYIEEKYKIVDMIKRMLPLSDDYNPYQRIKVAKEKQENTLKGISKRVNKVEYHFIKSIIEKMRLMIWWREELKDVSTRYYHLIRIYTLLLAEEFNRKNIIDDKDDIWYLKLNDILGYIDGKKTSEELKIIVRKNRLYYNSYRNFMSENEIGSPIKSNIHHSGVSIKGVVANSGTVTATARVLNNISEIGKLNKGDILVTKFTDTGWTPQFATISGIVTEYGGVLCHAATVAREYNIPAIVCCKNINKIKDGSVITINGETGEVIVHE